MGTIFETDLSKKEIFKRVGNLEQIAHIRELEMKSGKSTGAKVYEVVNGSGLEFTVLGDKCMDIFELKYKGVPFHYISKAGLATSERYSPDPARFLKNFQGGMLYTCGLLNVGPACVDQGKHYGTHGEISHTPATRTSLTAAWVEDEYFLKLEGEMREASLFGENLVLCRKISTSLGSKSVKIQDTLENQGNAPQPFMLLYHFNFGYPILDDALRIIIPSIHTRPRNPIDSDIIDTWHTVSLPIDDKEEDVFYHQVAAEENGFSYVALFNDRLGLGALIKYDTRNLPNLIQWKSMGSGDYALGIEPANCFPEGRLKEKQQSTIKIIEPFEQITFEIEFTVIEGKDQFDAVESSINQLLNSR